MTVHQCVMSDMEPALIRHLRRRRHERRRGGGGDGDGGGGGGGGRIRRERVFRDQHHLLAHDDDWLISPFRLPRAVLLELCAELVQHWNGAPGAAAQSPCQHR